MFNIPTDKIEERLSYGTLWRRDFYGQWKEKGTPVCLMGALRACMPDLKTAALAEAVAEHHGWGTVFNDSAGCYDDVIFELRQHPQITDEEMLATFGPYWHMFVAMLGEAEGVRDWPLYTAMTPEDYAFRDHLGDLYEAEEVSSFTYFAAQVVRTLGYPAYVVDAASALVGRDALFPEDFKRATRQYRRAKNR